jgi:hypothetical protein
LDFNHDLYGAEQTVGADSGKQNGI